MNPTPTQPETQRHLTAAQLDLLLFASSGTGDARQGAEQETIAAHLHACPACAAELADLRVSFGILRDATTAYAQRNLATARHAARPRPELRGWRTGLRLPALVALAASVAVVAALVPALVHPPVTTRPANQAAHAPVVPSSGHPVDADEALMLEIDDQLSASVPTALQPLANPEDTAAASSSRNSTSTPQTLGSTKKD